MRHTLALIVLFGGNLLIYGGGLVLLIMRLMTADPTVSQARPNVADPVQASSVTLTARP